MKYTARFLPMLFFILLSIACTAALISNAAYGTQYDFLPGVMLFPLFEMAIALIAAWLAAGRAPDVAFAAIALPALVLLMLFVFTLGFAAAAPILLLMWGSVMKLWKVVEAKKRKKDALGILLQGFGFNVFFAVMFALMALVLPHGPIVEFVAVWYVMAAYAMFKIGRAD